MTLKEKASYVKGLLDGLAVDNSVKETKLFVAVVDLLNDMASSISELEDEVDDASDRIDSIEDKVSDLEEDMFCDDEDDDCDCDDCECDDCDCNDCDDEEYYEVKCPTCNENICMCQDIVKGGSIDCPNCGELLEFDLEDEKCHCDCECDDDCDCDEYKCCDCKDDKDNNDKGNDNK